MKTTLNTAFFSLLGILVTGIASAHLSFTDQSIVSDFDGDGQNEVARIIQNDPGGSGVFYYLVVTDTGESGELRFAATFLGDRVQFLGFRDDGGTITLNMIQAGEGDAACCPTHKVVRRWKLKDGRLEEVPAQFHGQVSINDLLRLKWRLIRMDDQNLPEDAGFNLVFGAEQVIGRSGCNRYMASVQEPTPGKLKITAPMAATQMACPPTQMEKEQRFLQQLQQVNGYRWMGKYMSLDWQENGKHGSLTFQLVEGE